MSERHFENTLWLQILHINLFFFPEKFEKQKQILDDNYPPYYFNVFLHFFLIVLPFCL